MKHTWLLSAAAFALAASGAIAADSVAKAATDPAPQGSAGGPASGDMPSHGDHHQWTLAEARKHAHERADKLDKMTEQEYQAEEAKRHQEFSQKWHNMSDQEKQAWKDMKKKNAAAAQSPATISPAAGGNAPKTPGGSN